MDEIDKEIETMLILKEPRNFQEYLGIEMTRSPEFTIEEDMRDVQWQFSEEKGTQWFRMRNISAMYLLALIGCVIYANYVSSAGIIVYIVLGLIVSYVIISARQLVLDTVEEEDFKNA